MRIPILLVSLAMASTAPSARAQERPLAQLLPDLILREIVLLPGLIGPAHVAHFSPLTNDPNNPVIADRAELQLADGDTVLDVSARILERWVDLCVRRFGRHLPPRQRQLRTLVRRARAHHRPAKAERRIQLPAHLVRHDSRDSVSTTGRSSSICGIRIAAISPTRQPDGLHADASHRERPSQSAVQGGHHRSGAHVAGDDADGRRLCQLRCHDPAGTSGLPSRSSR